MKINIYALFKVRVLDIREAVNIFGVPFSHVEKHPLVATLLEYKNNPNIDCRDTALYRYHKNFCPVDTFQAFGVEFPKGKLPLFIYPWGAFRENYEGGKDVLKSRFCGPSSEEFIEYEFKHIVNLYNSILNRGYSLFNRNNILGGTYVIDENRNSRFVVLQGNHRLSVLFTLGFKRVLVRTMPGYIEKVHLSDLKDWVNVKNGNCDLLSARKIFSQFI